MFNYAFGEHWFESGNNTDMRIVGLNKTLNKLIEVELQYLQHRVQAIPHIISHLFNMTRFSHPSKHLSLSNISVWLLIINLLHYKIFCYSKGFI